MRAIVLGIGDELLTGQVVDTNSAYLAARLGEMGIRTCAHWTVGDDLEAIAAAVRDAAARADVVILSGGLGPTPDDVTRDAIADALGAPLVVDEDCRRRIEAFFARRGRTMTDANRVQAMIPEGAEALENASGTAPGIVASLGETRIFALPGVPQEMRVMFQTQVLPRLPTGSGATAHKIVHTFGRGESEVAGEIADLMRPDAPTAVGTTVKAGVVSIRVWASGADRGQAEAKAERTVSEIRRRLGSLVFGVGEQTLASVVGERLRETGQTLATAESCTGGILGELITTEPGASDYYLGGFVCYANALKARLLGVPGELVEAQGAVSEPVAAAMAEGCRRRTGSDWAISTTGVAGPTGGTPEKPVGIVYVAVCGPDGTRVRRHLFGGDRGIIRLRGGLAGLNGLRLRLTGASQNG